jgi:hypothetical protein
VLYFISKTILKKNREDHENLIETAIRGGNLEIFKDICSGKLLWELDNIMITASTFGTLEMVTFCIQRGAVYYFQSLLSIILRTIQYQNIDIITLLFERGNYMLNKFHYKLISDYMSIYTSHRKLNSDVLNIMIQYCKHHLSKEDYVSIILGNVWRYCTDNVDIPESIKKLQRNKFVLNLVMKLQIHAIDINKALKYAAYFNDCDAFKYLMEQGATDFVGALKYAILSPSNTSDIKRMITVSCNLTTDDYINALYFFDDVLKI